MFVRGSIEAVLHTLIEAILLVVIVVIVFLQTWRASIIPLLAVPVSLIGTLGVMHLFGFGLNTLSLFGLVLAIGIVVDDAIVVVENVERNITEGLSPVAATVQAMKEVTGPIVATALVLCAVFVPTAFISGLSGQFYKQFALTIAISTVISAFNSLTLSPALSRCCSKRTTRRPTGSRACSTSCSAGSSAVQPLLRSRVERLRARRRARAACGRDRDLRLRRPHRPHRIRLLEGADRLRARAGQTVSRRVRAAAGRGDTRSHDRG